MADALFEPDGDRFVPGVLTRGPWSPGAQHGGPPAALLAFDAETVVESHGIGLAESRLSDERGPIGRAVQSLLLERAP